MAADDPFGNDRLDDILQSPDTNPFTPGTQPGWPNGNTSTALPPPAPKAGTPGTTVGAGDVYTGESRILSAAEIAQYAYDAGFRGQALVTAVAVALAESSGKTGTFGPEQPNTPANRWMYLGGNPRGLWQIIPSKEDSGVVVARDPGSVGYGGKPGKSGPRDARKLFDPAFNARSAYTLSKSGNDWTPWTTYTAGTYTKYLQAAKAGVAEVGHLAVTGDDQAETNGTPTVDPAWANGPTYPLRIGSAAKAGDIAKRLVGGQYDASVKQPSQVTLELDDPGLTLLNQGTIKPGTRIAVNNERYTIIEPGISTADTGPRVTATALRSEIVTLMHTDPPTTSNIYAYDYVATLARAAGLSIVQTGRRTNGGRQTITPQTLQDAEPLIGPLQRALNPYAPPPPQGEHRESGWDIITRLASDLSYDTYLLGTSLYWAPVTGANYVAQLRTVARIAWAGQPVPQGAGALRALATPQIQLTSPAQGRYARATATFTLAPEHRWAIKPGQAIDLGIDPLLTATTPTATGVKLPTYMRATRITWPLADLTAPVVIEAETAIDNTIADDTADPDADGANDTGALPGATDTAGNLLPAVKVPGTSSRAVDPSQAVRNALAAVGGKCVPYSCMHTVGVWNGLAYSGWPLARDGWFGTPAAYRHANNYDAPPGALYYWDGGSAGHVAEATGSGYCVTTDYPVSGRVGQVKAATLTSTWHKQYLGWTMPYFPAGG